MLDKTIPYIGVIMEKHDPKNYPHYRLPEGYVFCNYENGFEHYWSKIEFELGQTNTVEEAEEIFRNEFLKFPEELPKKCFFVKDTSGNIVATASVWHGDHFGTTLQRIHWVAVAENHQGKGIAKALLTKVLDIYNELSYKDYIYLVSQTWSYKALNIYSKFGFIPYMGEKPINWECDNFDEENIKAWSLITDKINSYLNK